MLFEMSNRIPIDLDYFQVNCFILDEEFGKHACAGPNLQHILLICFYKRINDLFGNTLIVEKMLP